jgi:hypothetical protein
VLDDLVAQDQVEAVVSKGQLFAHAQDNGVGARQGG